MKNKKSVTLTDIAKELNIDTSTVSKAMTDHPKISEVTKEKVRKVARRLNYRPNDIATALVKGKSNLLGVMVPHTDENFFASVIRGIEEVVKQKGYRLIIFQSYDNPQDEISNIETMYRTKVDGIIASHAMRTTNFDHYQDVLDQGIPLILFDRFIDSMDSDVVAINDFKGGYKATSHLIEQGCTRIAHIAGQLNVHIYKERLRGYRAALEDYGLPYDESLVHESDMSLNDGKTFMKSLLKREPLPDAVFTSNDYTALGALQVLKEHNIKVPEQVAVVGFSNEDFTSFVTPAITSIEQHSQKMGKIAAQLFIDQVSDQSHRDTSTDKLTQKTLLTPELVIRASSMKKGNK